MGPYDVLIVGLGPAGATCALHLAVAGLRVRAIDSAIFPREKPCGGWISPRVGALLPEQLKLPTTTPITALTFHQEGQEPFTIATSRDLGGTVSRADFDAALSHAALRRGAEISPGVELLGYEVGERMVKVRTSGGTFSARYLVGADGAAGRVACLGGMGRRRGYPTLTSRVKVPDRILAENAGNVHVSIHPLPMGYGWIFPHHDGLTVGMGIFKSGSRVRGLRAAMGRFLALHPLLKDGIPGPMRGHPIPVPGGVSPARGRIFLVGDAAGLVDPLLGEGIPYAIRSGQLAAQAIAGHGEGRGAARIYAQALKSEFGRHFTTAGAIAALVFRFPTWGFSLLRNHRLIAAFYHRVFSGRESYHALWSWASRNQFEINPHSTEEDGPAG